MENVATLGVLLTSLLVRSLMSMDCRFYCSWYSPLGDRQLTDDEITAGKYYEWNETAYQADNTKGWDLKTLNNNHKR